MDGIGSTISLKRGTDGRIIYQVRGAQNAKLGNAAYVKGDIDFKIGTTQNGDETQFMFKSVNQNEDNLITLQNTNNLNYNLLGDGLNVKSQGGNAERTIQVDGTNTNLDLSDAGGSQVVYMSENSSNNKTYLGSGNDNYTDAGKFNYVKDEGGSNTFGTEGTSHGAVIVAGSGNDQITLMGDFGVVDAGEGANTINLVGFWGDVANEETAYRNIVMSGEGDDTITDNGGYNLIFDAGGTNKMTSGGSNGIAFVGEDTTDDLIQNSSDRGYIFKTEEDTINGVTYNLYDVMSRTDYGWGSLYKYLEEYSQIDENDLRSLYDQNVLDAQTFQKLTQWFGENVGESSIDKEQINQLV